MEYRVYFTLLYIYLFAFQIPFLLNSKVNEYYEMIKVCLHDKELKLNHMYVKIVVPLNFSGVVEWDQPDTLISRQIAMGDGNFFIEGPKVVHIQAQTSVYL